MTGLGHVHKELVTLVERILDLAATPEELLDCARAAAATADRGLMTKVAQRVGDEVHEMLETSGAWEVQAAFSKLDSWAHSGQKAAILAEAWGLVGRPLVAVRAV